MDGYEGVDNTFNIGMTIGAYEDRHRGGDYGKQNQIITAFDSQRKRLGWWVGFNGTDHEIHDWLKKQPHIKAVFGTTGANVTETFRISGGLTLEIVRDMIEKEFFSGYQDKERKQLALLPYQQEFVGKAYPPYKEFLLAAKCRAGKSVMVLMHILTRTHKVSLIVSRFKSPSQSWLSDVATFDVFNNMVTVNMADRDWKKQYDYWMNTDKQIILWSTIQGVLKKLEKINVVDLLVFDEAHVGDKANQFIKLRDHFSHVPCLKVSGTAFDQLWDTTEDNRFVYDYFQEQLDVRSGIVKRPTMEVILAKYESDRYATLYGDEPDAMRNLFLIKDNQFVDEQLVKEFISKYFEPSRELRTRDRLLHNSNHIYMCLPSVAACHLFRELLNPVIPTMVVTGDTHVTADAINKFVSEHNQTVCLTVCANVLGVTQRLWDTIINCREGKSVQFWTQFAFRGGSGEHNWRVIDFVPTRALESLRETFVLANDLNPNLTQYEFVDFVPIHEWNCGFKTLSVSEVNKILASDVGSTARLMSGGTEGVDVSELNKFDFQTFLDHKKEVTKRVELNDQANNGESAKKIVPNNTITPQQMSDLQKKIATIKSVLSLTPQVIFEERQRGTDINTIADVVQSSLYATITGDGIDLLEELLDDGILSSAVLSRRVYQTRLSIDTAVLNEAPSDVLINLCVDQAEQQCIPMDVFEEMIK